MRETSPATPDAAPAAEGQDTAAGRRAPPPPTLDDPLFGHGNALLDEDVARANWAVPWSDLMMTMFVLFAALLAAQSMHHRAQEQARLQQAAAQARNVPEFKDRMVERVVEREQPVPEPVKEPVRDEVLSRNASLEPPMTINVLERSREAVREANLQDAEIVLMDDQSVKVSVQGPMFFALGKADLRPEVTQFLDRLAQVIKQTPYEIHVVGHTDDLPINTAEFPSNWELSLVRASRVARYLIKSGGLVPSRFVVMGRGEYDPAAANAGERSRALNRRVEIIITRNVVDSEKTRQR